MNSSDRTRKFPQTRRQILHLILSAFILLGGLAVIDTAPAEAGTKITSLTHAISEFAVGYPHQRKLVRDANGYWYAVWMAKRGSYYDIYMSKSNDTEGTSWATPVEIAGDGGIVAYAYDARFPAIDIDRTNGKIHLIWIDLGSAYNSYNSLYYSKLADLNSWNVAAGWTQLQGGTSTRYDIVSYYTYAEGTPEWAASIAVDPSGNVHVGYLSDPLGG